MNEPRATLLIRTGVNSAKIVRMPHSSRLIVMLKPHGLELETEEEEPAALASGPESVATVDCPEIRRVRDGRRLLRSRSPPPPYATRRLRLIPLLFVPSNCRMVMPAMKHGAPLSPPALDIGLPRGGGGGRTENREQGTENR